MNAGIQGSRSIEKLQKRGLVQSRGKWRAVLPHAISNRLALQSLESYPKEILTKRLIDNASERVARSFSRRLGFLHESRGAKDIVEEWLRPSGRIGDLTKLDELGRQIFGNIAPVDQKAALEALLKATESREFVATANRNRGHFARIARSLAYEPELFENAAEVLSRFALAEPEGYNYDTTRDTLKSLFSCHLSGTEAPVELRAKFTRKLMSSSERAKRKLGLTLLSAALEAWHFSSHHGFDFGARKRGYGWWPRTYDDVRSWYRPFIDIAVEFGKDGTEFGRESRVLLGMALRGLWVKAELKDEMTAAARELAAIDGWPEGWLGTRRVLHWDKAKISKESLSALGELERELAPRDIRANILARVLARGSFAFDLDDDDDESEPASSRYCKAGDEAEALGKQAAVDVRLLDGLLPDLLRHNASSNIWSFGYGVGQSAFSPRKLMDEARIHVKSADLTGLSLIFLRGLISGWHKVKPDEVSVFLDEAIYDDVWGVWFPELQLRVELDDAAHARLMKAIELGKAPSWQFQYLGMGRATDSLSVGQVSTLINAIASRSDGLPVAIHVLSMVIHCSEKKQDNIVKNLPPIASTFSERLTGQN